MAFKLCSKLETPEAEAARLAQSEEGSTHHRLSRMPVNIHGDFEGILIELPRFGDEPDHTVVVLPIESHRLSGFDPEELPRRRYQNSWTCIVVASNRPNCQVGGYRVSIPEYQLRRGVQRTLGL